MIIIDITLKGKYHKLRCTNNKEKADTTLNAKNSITLISIVDLNGYQRYKTWAD